MTSSHTLPTSRRIGRGLSETALNLAALGGLIALTLVALAFFFNISLIMFKTGSMSPTIPTGSVSIVHEIPAAEISVGDVVTVDRSGELPVTHRVTSASAVAADGSRSITLKGDANELEDPAPYTVSQVRIVLWSAPGLAAVIVWFSNPLVLGSITCGATALVMGAFWPRRSAQREAAAPRAQRVHGRHAALAS
ncbi:signal peptidase I [Glaciibacter psychrotolerans]|uniref:Signal peptidase I n=1 Tax=Glaciibacter psychrotolerans TaxID=670054 RepID=A0A7Z0J6Y2_9MICO|nr:signal peptidase I [Leifsonia psychrotolerans]NYJ20408.1 signal peptidase [Leifsonia psychrotolerans]